MKPIKFPESNCVYLVRQDRHPVQRLAPVVHRLVAEDQPEYLPLPVHKTEEGEVISCWKLSWKERWQVLVGGKMWWSVLTFHHPLQPQRPYVTSPFEKKKS